MEGKTCFKSERTRPNIRPLKADLKSLQRQGHAVDAQELAELRDRVKGDYDRAMDVRVAVRQGLRYAVTRGVIRVINERYWEEQRLLFRSDHDELTGQLNRIRLTEALAEIRVGNALPLHNIPDGTMVHAIEMSPGKGAQLARSAGTGVQLLAREGVYAQLRLRSGEIRKVHVDCRATIGEVGNEEHSLRSIGKAGANRWRGIRPTVRGICMNPVDHPHGGRSNGGGHPVSPWGTPTKGYKTRRNKRTDSMIVRRRHAAKG